MKHHSRPEISSISLLDTLAVVLLRCPLQVPKKLPLATTFLVSFAVTPVVGLQAVHAFGALAVGDGTFGASWNYEEVADARGRALNGCGVGCHVVLTFKNTCAAFASDQGKNGSAIGWSYASTQEEAQDMALDFCRRSGGEACAVRASACESAIARDARAFAVYEGDATAAIGVVSEPLNENPNFGFIFSDSDRRRLSTAELIKLSRGELRIARNEIFARRGRTFVSSDLSFYFSQFMWYAPIAPEVTLSDVETDNVVLIVDAERPTTHMCGHPHGDYVVINVKWEDSIGGLAVRDGPSAAANRLGIIPSDGTGIGIGQCQVSGWCHVKYECLSGWSLLAGFLARKPRQNYKVVNVLADNPEGLNIRQGPGSTFGVKGRVRYDSSNLTLHTCEPSPVDQTDWCLVSYGDLSGWAAGRYLAPNPVSERSSQPIGTVPPERPEACKQFPNLCAE